MVACGDWKAASWVMGRKGLVLPVFVARTDTGAFSLRVSGRIAYYLGYWHQRADERDGNPHPR